GGQLARFLSLMAQEMGFQVRLLCQDSMEPAAQVTRDVVLGDLSDGEIRRKFLDQLDVVTFESEFVDASPIEGQDNSFEIHPSTEMMNLIRDRKTQKQWLHEGDLPTAEDLQFENKRDLAFYFENSNAAFVLKKRLFGYDGYGTVVVQTPEDLDKVPENVSPKDWIAESFCPFERELAFSIARNKDNQFYILPLVETKQTDSKCDWVKGPVKHRRLNGLIKKLKKLMKSSKYVGLLSVELFDSKGQLLINELAPRVHNSGHHSIESLQVSQFEAHVRAILNLPLPKKPLLNARGFAMANLIGTKEASNLDLKLGLWPEGEVHWYNKTSSRPGRKLGHLTLFSSSADKALKLILKWRKSFWH
ncbi:MAG TPA: hypothetical protein DCL41_10740, partial [Bdellovibrionales bacterium]|nr:hypothetical protein [Bdellovibrionales bacterium]